ncbi:MAG: DUF4159 domain-containing protein [Planctomycetia bacterium]|nr:DUF4159 domain-containing protein [Planctomycetia bacterium]
MKNDLSPELVREAIEGGITFLKVTQFKNGSWEEPDTQHVGGFTALCTLALLNAGVTVEDPCMQRALKYLRRLNPTKTEAASTYVTSLQTMVFCMAEPEVDENLIRRNVQWLTETQISKGAKEGAWSYPNGNGDPSNSQFALLALYEAERIGYAVPDIIWERATKYWGKFQNVDGSWAYLNLPPTADISAPGTGSMTCAGIVSLLIASEKSQPADARIASGKLIPCLRTQTDDSKRISHGMRWMRSHFSVTRNPGSDRWIYYYLYGMERLGRMTSQRYMGQHDWFREGTHYLLMKRHMMTQKNNVVVFWKGDVAPHETYEIISTAFALLFLSKGRLPLLLSKVEYTEDASDYDWNWHRHDTINLTAYVERQWKRNLTTQNLKLAAASVEDLLHSPVLYLGGVNSPLPKDAKMQREYAQKLRDYLDRGGFIIAEAVAPGGTFDAGFRRLLALMFPEEEISPYLMPPEHPIWTAEKKIPPEFLRPVYCLDHGCRTALVYIPMKGNQQASLSCTWELANELKRQNRHLHSSQILAEIEAGLNLGVNILAYATHRELKTKDTNFALQQELTPENIMVNRGKLAVANLRHGGGCDVAPTALRNLLIKSSEVLNIRSGILEKTINITSPEIFDYPVVFMQGRHAFRLTPAEKKQLQTYLLRGGTIFANAICASKEFDASFREMISEIMPENKMSFISPEDPLLSSRFGGYDLSTVSVRMPRKDFSRPSPSQKSAPRLEGIYFQDHYAVIYSSLDISCALEKHAGECMGYTAEDAAKIGINILLYTLQQ